MRPVIHHTADADDTGAWVLRKRIDDGLRLRERLRARREHLVDDRHLRRMDGHLADKAVAAGFLAFAAKTFAVAKIDIDGVERRHIGGGGTGETQYPRQPIGIEKAALRVAVP